LKATILPVIREDYVVYREVPMGTVMAARGVIPQQGLPQERITRQTRLSSEARSAARERFEATLPGNKSPGNAPVDISPAVADLERVTLAFNRRLKFEVDHESHEVTVKVIDGETDKVIKVLPPEELQRLHDNIKETIGFLFDERV
jgi:flagellar protein FlaG